MTLFEPCADCGVIHPRTDCEGNEEVYPFQRADGTYDETRKGPVDAALAGALKLIEKLGPQGSPTGVLRSQGGEPE